MSIYPDLPFVHALGDGGARSVSQVVVIHATDGTGTARNEADYATHRPDKTSAHFYVDEAQTIQALDTSHIAYGCLYHGNHISVQFELCGRSNQISDDTMRRAAPTVARVCREFGIPVRHLSADQVRAGVKGICGHDAITAAFPEDGGDHTDPGGAFPWATFISYVTGGTMSDADIPDTHRLASNADTWTRALVKGEDPAYYLGAGSAPPNYSTTPNVLHQRLKEILAAVKAGTGQSTPITQDQLDAAVLKGMQDPTVLNAIVSAVPTAAQIADELAKRLGNG
jgi:hypothetical protein